MGSGRDRAGRSEHLTRDSARVATDERSIDVGDDLQLHVVSAGEGPPLLLLHGFTGSAGTWSSLQRLLSDRFTLHAIDLPGHGRSGAPRDSARYAIDRFATDLTRVLDALALDRAAVLGYSLGGRAALCLALDHPSRVAALVLESASPGIVDPTERARRRAADHALAESIEREGVEAFVDRWERLPLWASQSAVLGSVRASLRAERLANQAHGLANSLRGAGAAAGKPVLDRLGVVAAPALLIAGALDAKYVELAQLMARSMPRAVVQVVERAGHAVHLEQPETFATLVAEFLGAPR